MINKRFLFVLSVIFIISFIVGCAKPAVEQSGFLDNYANLEQGREDGVDKVYFKEGVDFKKYNKIMLDHVVFFFNDDAKYKGVHPDMLKELADAFHLAIAEALEGAYPLVDKPGADVMRIRLAITDVVPNKPSLNYATTILPGGFGVKGITKVTTGSHSFLGNTAMEAEVLDSLTDTQIALAMDSRGKGDKISAKEGLTKWGDVKNVFKFWGQRLRIWLDETHGIMTNDE
jgi:hypothetical protein